MAKVIAALALLAGATADNHDHAHATWSKPQQEELPSHEWIVVDHAVGTSFGLGVCVAGNSVFTAGSMAYGITLTNAATGAAIEGANAGADRDIFLAKIAQPAFASLGYSMATDSSL
jgi:hypothetical protein